MSTPTDLLKYTRWLRLAALVVAAFATFLAVTLGYTLVNAGHAAPAVVIALVAGLVAGAWFALFLLQRLKGRLQEGVSISLEKWAKATAWIRLLIAAWAAFIGLAAVGVLTKTPPTAAEELTTPLLLFVVFGALYGLLGGGLNDYLAVWDEETTPPGVGSTSTVA